jgi:RNA polymerase sigma-70 factor, ECF subfamily
MADKSRKARFEREVLPHLDAAHNFALWLLRNRADAEDATQEAMLRAFRYFDGFKGGSAKAWLLKIVRNACYSYFAANPKGESLSLDGEERLDPAHERALAAFGAAMPGPEAALLAKLDRERLTAALEALPPGYREALLLREIEELSYKEIAAIAELPIGTVMSRIARGRSLLAQRLAGALAEEA